MQNLQSVSGGSGGCSIFLNGFGCCPIVIMAEQIFALKVPCM